MGGLAGRKCLIWFFHNECSDWSLCFPVYQTLTFDLRSRRKLMDRIGRGGRGVRRMEEMKETYMKNK